MKRTLSLIMAVIMIFGCFAICSSAVSAPSKVRNLKYSSTTSSSVKLSWSAVSGAKGYIIYKYITAEKKYVKVTSTSSTAKTVSGLKAGTTYKFSVAGYKYVSGKYYIGTKSSLVTVKTKSLSLSNSTALSLYKKAEKVATHWLSWKLQHCDDDSCVNYSDYIDYGYDRYFRIKHSGINSVSAVKKYLSKYFTKDVYNDIVNEYYTEYKGKLYAYVGNGTGDGYSYKLTSLKVTSISGNIAKIKITVKATGGGDYADVFYTSEYMKLIYTDGTWKFTDPFYTIWYVEQISV